MLLITYKHDLYICTFDSFYRNCSDYDLCETCEGIDGIHIPSHVFLKLHYPSNHAGRKSYWDAPKPLLNANIYEERETEREK